MTATIARWASVFVPLLALVVLTTAVLIPKPVFRKLEW